MLFRYRLHFLDPAQDYHLRPRLLFTNITDLFSIGVLIGFVPFIATVLTAQKNCVGVITYYIFYF